MNPRILIADDETSVRLALARWFSIRGFDVTEAADGQEAVEAVERVSFDIVLLDLEMPRLHGLDALALMREAQPGLRVVVLSGYARDKARAWDRGAALVLSKPIRLAVLEQHVREVLEDPAAGTDPTAAPA